MEVDQLHLVVCLASENLLINFQNFCKLVDISHGKSIYTTEIGKFYKTKLPPPQESNIKYLPTHD